MDNITDQLLKDTKEFEIAFSDIIPQDEMSGRLGDVWKIVSNKTVFRKLTPISNCESPIEKMLCLCLLEQIESLRKKHNILFDTQFEIEIESKHFRLDFYIEISSKTWYPSTHKIIIECDGHEFHEKTKSQAKRDKERDRIFTRNGYHILRYTGQEITIDPFGCSNEIIQTLRKLLRDGEHDGEPSTREWLHGNSK